MAPKKRKPGAQTAEQAKAVFSEVERAFYELQLTDLNRKIGRLRQAVSDYEIRNEELQNAYDKLDEDRADIIAYLKKTLNLKTEENNELKEKVKGLEELRVIETAQFKETVNELENNFTKMKDQLTSENKLLTGKLNTLEEFRAIRDDLMKKFEKNERAFEEQELKYKRIIYDTEKKFIVGKDRLKKEMEGRLLELAQQFQDASELRIAASTHRVIRENIALNNQLDSLLLTQAKVAEQNEKFREDERAARCAKEVAEEEREAAMNKSIVQLKVIDQLTAAFEDVKKQKALYDKKLFDQDRMQIKIQRLQKENKNLLLQVRILEQNLHATMDVQNKSVVETEKLLKEREMFKQILKESAYVVQASLKLDNWASLNPSREILDREVVLNNILQVINQYLDAAETHSMESLISLSKVYEKGDLGVEVVRPAKKLQKTPSDVALFPVQSLVDKRSIDSVASSVSLRKSASVRTIPSVELIPVDEDFIPEVKESLPSFTVTSLHSSVSTSLESEESEDINEMSRMLALSKASVQRSLMADLELANLSRMSQRIGLSDEMATKSTTGHVAFSISKTIVETIEDKQHETTPREDGDNGGESNGETDKPTQDKAEPPVTQGADAEVAK